MLDDTARQFEQAMQAKKYDFIDFGANKDGVIAFVCKAFGAEADLASIPTRRGSKRRDRRIATPWCMIRRRG